jgi:dienelactone hydrolase
LQWTYWSGGFCFGGWIANMMAVKIPELCAAVPYYGGQPTAEEAEQIKRQSWLTMPV